MTIEYRIKIVDGEVIVRQSVEGDGSGSSGGGQGPVDPGPASGGQGPVDPGPGGGSITGSHAIVFGPTIIELSPRRGEAVPKNAPEDAKPKQ